MRHPDSNSQSQTARILTPRIRHSVSDALIWSPELGLPGSATLIPSSWSNALLRNPGLGLPGLTPRFGLPEIQFGAARGDLGAAWRSHGPPLWLPCGCLEVPWGTYVAPLGLPGGSMWHLCGSLGDSWGEAWPKTILKAKQANWLKHS